MKAPAARHEGAEVGRQGRPQSTAPTRQKSRWCKINTRVLAFTISTADPGLSEPIDLQDYRFHALQMSTAWTAGSISILAASNSGDTFTALYYQGAAQLLTVDASRVVDLSTMGLEAVRFAQFRSTAPQAAERSLVLISKK